MSYRNYLYEINNDKLSQLENLTVDEVKKKFGDRDDFVWLPDLVSNIVFEYGSVSDFDEAISKIATPLFRVKETHNHFNDGEQDIRIVDKEALLITIEMMRKEVAEMYKKYALDPLMAITFLSHRAIDWSATRDIEEDFYRGYVPYNLYKDATASDATHYEYAIFELVRLFKTIDLSDKALVYMGY